MERGCTGWGCKERGARARAEAEGTAAARSSEGG